MLIVNYAYLPTIHVLLLHLFFFSNIFLGRTVLINYSSYLLTINDADSL